MIKFLSSWKFALACGLLLCAFAAVSSFIEYSEADVVYDSVPFIVLWVLFSISLFSYIVQVIRRPHKRLYQWGLIVMHSGILIVLIAVTSNRFSGLEGTIYLLEGMQQNVYLSPDETAEDLGFTVKCNNFTVEYYDNSTRVKSNKTLLTVIDDGNELTVEIDVNRPLTYKGITFYQNSYGFYPNSDGHMIFSALLNGISHEYQTYFNEEIKIDEETTVKIVDFSPALAFTPEGTFYNYSEEAMLNPAAFFEINRSGDQFLQWVLMREPESGMIDKDFTLVFDDFWGVEYTALSVSKKPFSILVYIGFIVITAGFAMIYLPRMRTTR